MDTALNPKSKIQNPKSKSWLRPRDIGGLLDQAVVLYRRNFVTYVGIAALMQIPATVLLTLASIFLLDPASIARTPALPPPGADPSAYANYQTATAALLSDTLSRGLLTLIISLLGAILTNIAAGALARAIAAGYMGQSLGILDSYRAIGRQIPRLTGLILLVGLSTILVIIPPLWIWIYIGWIFAAQAIVLEDASVTGALQRSWELVRGSWWRVFGAYLLLLIISAIIGLADTIATPLIGVLGLSWALQSILLQFISLLVAVLYVPIQRATLTLLYFDLRVRREGFDLQVALDERAAEVGLEPAAGTPARPGEATPAWPYRPAAPGAAQVYAEPAGP